jgi:hypothetical protein
LKLPNVLPSCPTLFGGDIGAPLSTTKAG